MASEAAPKEREVARPETAREKGKRVSERDATDEKGMEAGLTAVVEETTYPRRRYPRWLERDGNL